MENGKEEEKKERIEGIKNHNNSKVPIKHIMRNVVLYIKSKQAELEIIAFVTILGLILYGINLLPISDLLKNIFTLIVLIITFKIYLSTLLGSGIVPLPRGTGK